jgi:hypothetical protein
MTSAADKPRSPTIIAFEFRADMTPDEVRVDTARPVGGRDYGALKDALKEAFGVAIDRQKIPGTDITYMGIGIDTAMPEEKAVVLLGESHLQTPDLGNKMEKVMTAMKKMHSNSGRGA